MTNDWRTVQLFLDVDGVAEVEVDSKNPKLTRCTCPSHNSVRGCAHTKYVKKNMQENDGHYTVSIPVEVDDEDAIAATSSAEAFRNFIIKYGKVEVI
jgi:hypothetical protein